MRTLLKIISYLFQPLLMPLFGIIILLQTPVFKFFPLWYHIIAISGTILFTAILPTLPIVWMMRKGEIHDMFISKREERTMPYLFSLLAYVFWVLFLSRTLHFPMSLLVLAIGCVVSIFVMVLINLKWKISAHATGIGGLAGGIFGVCYQMAINPVWLFVAVVVVSGLVAISRIYLKAHTISQVIVGFLLGFLVVFVPSLFF
ncbi:Phosphoesterase PA-phosphatase related protein [uncultured Paludibacter sp.]|uniref:Phosphoesterase PA-phosphatase related protein n=1 Tax=uncultured Paludibacter sp. TaxID=497635 RepID=A0A653AGI9_9BACT|nr:Phosphoesterase PA-phosphatase related protein [uncultured Paludibacter sp.]